jgi:membrane-bound lytic murein transglycosylase D
MKKTITATLIFCASTLCAGAVPSLLSIKDTIHDNSIVYPESYETDTKKMLENWYLQNYAVLDREADAKASVQTSDEVLIDRLGKMPTVIEMPFNSIVRSCIDRYANNRKQLIENVLGLSLYYMPIFEQALDRYGLPLELKYLPIVESALDPSAVSRVGATGLWQFMLTTANGLGLEINSIIDERRDPYTASDAAARYLKQLYETFNDWSLAVAAYNCGPGNINKALRRAGGGKKDFWEIYPYLPQETRSYFPTFIAANYIMTYYNMHNISPALAKKPIVTDTIHVTRRVHFDQISEVLNIPTNELRLLNPQYRADIIPGDIKPYSLVLPSLQVYAYIANEDSIVNHNAALYARRDIVQPATAVSASEENGEYIEEQITKYHTVKKGETLSKIAKKYGVTVSSIRKTNKCGKSVSAGRRLKIVTTKRTFVPKPVSPDANTTEQPTNEPIESTQSVAQPAEPAEVAETEDDETENSAEEATETAPVTRATESAAPASEQRQQLTGAFNASADRKAKQEEAKKAEAKKAETQKANTQKADSKKADTKKQTAKKDTKKKSTSHTVKRGENLSKIAKQYGVTVKAIKDANNIKGDNINAGDKLTIPAKK